jgi:predicted AAA+ superfamily ATPase
MKKRFDRLIEPFIEDAFIDLPALAIDGLKAIGKTDSAMRLAKATFRMDLAQDRLVVENNMLRIAEAARPVLIDEWQKLPEVWDFVRREVDREPDPGRFILTGSISAKNLDVHSGAGRIVRVRMFPLSLQERGLDMPVLSLGRLLDSQEPCSMETYGETSVGFDRYVEEIALSGLPALRIDNERRRSMMLDSYLENLLTHDFTAEGLHIRQPRSLRKWLTAYAAAIASTAGYSQILDCATSGEGTKPALKTTVAYREALQRIWLIDELPAWLDGENYYSRLKRTPKHYLADTAFAVQLLGISVDSLLGRARDRPAHTRFDESYGNVIGRLFEALVYQSLRVYASVNGAELSYFCTQSGDREIDFILTRGARTIALEVKAAPTVTEGDVRHLLWLKRTMKERLTDMLLITTGPVAYRRPDGIAVVPACLLGA